MRFFLIVILVCFVSNGDDFEPARQNYIVPNGILVSLGGKRVFAADNHSDPDGNHHLVSFIVQKDGTLADKKILFDIGPNRRGIDGMTLNEQGKSKWGLYRIALNIKGHHIFE